ncbi:hypothetical protein BKA64DRAFT_763621 [Cadophora sp. MPI-SDFR-AT-0126]|nr:hypothetical protein BKA64DRAFT_763621 [Leotiomycetes sp. MPI-SDFR-AT-0126]
MAPHLCEACLNSRTTKVQSYHTMASHLQTQPKQQSVEERTGQEILASEDKEQHPANLEVPYSVPQKRRSADALNEQLLPRKHTARTEIDFGEKDALNKPGRDNEHLDLWIQMDQMTLDREERAKSKGYVEKEITLRDSRRCTLCGRKIQWDGKCWKCQEDPCRRWLEMSEPDEPNGEPDNVYLALLGPLWHQNQDRLAEEVEKWKEL